MALFLDAVVSMDPRQGIGYQGDLLIRLKADMAWFRKLTTDRVDEAGESRGDSVSENPIKSPPPAVIMGRKTWDSLPEKYRPLLGRRNYVLTRSYPALDSDKGLFFTDWKTLLAEARRLGGRVFVIGGAEVFGLALPDIRFLYVTEFQKQFPADTFFPPFREDFPYRKVLQTGEEDGIGYEIVRYDRG